MNKIIVGVIVAGVIVFGGFWYTSNQQAAKDQAMAEEQAMSEKAAMEKAATEKEAMMKKEEATKQSDAMMEKKTETMMAKSYAVTMKEQNGSKQVGTATIVDVDGKAKVTVKIVAGMQDAPQPAHIHVGVCPAPGAVAYPLSAVVNGMSETTLAISTTELLSKLPLAINVHKSKAEASVYTSCGDIVTDTMMKK